MTMVDDLKAITTAARYGDALHFIRSLPRKFNSVSGELHHPEAVQLSGGQWQRVALLRAFMRLSSADLMLLDEPAIHLDYSLGLFAWAICLRASGRRRPEPLFALASGSCRRPAFFLFQR